MSNGQPISVADFGAAFKGFLEQAVTQVPPQEPVFVHRLREHFGAEPATQPVVSETFDSTDHPNLQIALDAYLGEAGRSFTLVGIISEQKKYMGIGLSDLLMPARGGLMGAGGPMEGPVEYVNFDLDTGRVLTCVQSGLYLIGEGERRLAVLVSGPSRQDMRQKLRVEAMATERADAERFLAELRTLIRQRNVYRGHVLSLSIDNFGTLSVQFHILPQIGRDKIILPAGVIERVERHTLGFARHRDKLLAAGRHLKRGMLLHGPPGTGKTLTAMYLASQMQDRTLLLLTGRGLGLIQRSCAMARMLQPAMVILEDVDLVAEERTRPGAGCSPLLFELLNEMDGLADDADVIFLLTTNRPDLLEPALAARPGRVDQAIEVPLPDAECRRQLIALYSRGLTLRVTDMDRLVGQTEGVSAAFMRELLRKAALFAADTGDAIVVEDRHIADALHELVVEGGDLTKSLLGARRATAP